MFSKSDLNEYINKDNFFRNYLTHYSEKLENEKNKKYGKEDEFWDDLMNVNRFLKLILTVILLNYIGVSKERIPSI